MSIKWNGEGLPPVGTVCELEFKEGVWRKVTILLVTELSVVIRQDDKREALIPTDARLVFRPLRTKRDKWIDKAAIEAHKEGLVTTSAAREIAERIYDAGLAKDDEE